MFTTAISASSSRFCARANQSRDSTKSDNRSSAASACPARASPRATASISARAIVSGVRSS
jgi:hypothetical protein